MNTDTLVSFGGEVKSLGENRIGGHLVLFSDVKSPDLAGDFFTSETDFAFRGETERPLYYNHGFDDTLGTKRIGWASLKADAAGVWMDAQLELRDEYAEKIMQMVNEGALGLSSGALSHLVRREPAGKAYHITQWALGEGSLTPTPAEPRTSVMPLKSFVATLPGAESAKVWTPEDIETPADVEKWLRDTANLSRKGSTAFVSRCLSVLRQREAVTESKPQPLPMSEAIRLRLLEASLMTGVRL